MLQRVSRVRPRRGGVGAGRAEGGDPGREARQDRRARRAARVPRRCVRQHRDDPVEDDPRGDPLPDRAQPARDLRAELPAEGERLDRRHRAADAPGRRGGAAGHPRPAAPEPRDGARRLRAVRRPAHARDRRARRQRAARAGDRSRDRDRARRRRIRPRSSSTARPCSTATTSCCGSRSCRPRS